MIIINKLTYLSFSFQFTTIPYNLLYKIPIKDFFFFYGCKVTTWDKEYAALYILYVLLGFRLAGKLIWSSAAAPGALLALIAHSHQYIGLIRCVCLLNCRNRKDGKNDESRNTERKPKEVPLILRILPMR